MILRLDFETGFDHWDLLTVIVALWLMWPLVNPPTRAAKTATFHHLTDDRRMERTG